MTGRIIGGVPVRPARDLFHAPAVVFDAVRTSLRNPLVFTNAGAADRAFRLRSFWRYAAREENQLPVVAGWYRDAFIHGDGPFLLLTEGGFAAEHMPFSAPDAVLAPMVPPLLAARDRAVTVEEPCALVCNPGLWVWGHWLLEILPRAVLASRLFAGRIRLAVPRGLIAPEKRGFLAEQVLASLSLYGILPHQIFPIEEGFVYRFRQLADFSGVDGLRHPHVLAALRDMPGLPRAKSPRGLTAVLRGEGAKRTMLNRAEIATLLDRRGAGVMDPGRAPFAAQVMAFRDSEIVVGDMGSNLCAALYAQPGTGLVTLAPDRWDDGAVPRLLQDLDIHLADLRGETDGRTDAEIMTLPYRMDAAEVAAGLDAVTEAVRVAAPPDSARVAGRIVARRLAAPAATIRFGQDGDAGRYVLTGFDGAEPDGRWSLGPVCSMRLRGLDLPRQSYWLSLEGVGYAAPPRLPETVLSVEANGVVLARFDVSGDTRLEVLLPAEIMAQRAPLALRFHHPRCTPPATLGISGDARRLGFFFRRISLHPQG